MRYFATAATATLIVMLAACAPKPAPLPAPVPTPVPAPVVVIPPRPLPPGFAATTQQLPPRDMAGRYVTLNSNVEGDRAFWQLKTGLNVAAIGCRGAEEATLVAAYNQIIKSHIRVIQATEKKVIGALGKANGTNGVKERDRLSTQLFNYFAQPPAQAEFCRRAVTLAQVVATAPSALLVTNAPAQLVTLDEPFTQFYEAFARYQVDVEAWDARYGTVYGAGPAMNPPLRPVAFGVTTGG